MLVGGKQVYIYINQSLSRLTVTKLIIPVINNLHPPVAEMQPQILVWFRGCDQSNFGPECKEAAFSFTWIRPVCWQCWQCCQRKMALAKENRVGWQNFFFFYQAQLLSDHSTVPPSWPFKYMKAHITGKLLCNMITVFLLTSLQCDLMKDNMICSVITFQSCIILFQSIVNNFATFWHLINL